ncbi:MAG: ubiquinol-cytochrome c reductase iron-sulfur subunit [Thermodesulfovibrio sp.]|nr:ubiquinol-cytochrome c reductase iron-sulfur subunit [Thermodesulfovibrio sp.]
MLTDRKVGEERRFFLKKLFNFLFFLASISFTLLGLIVFKPSNPKRRDYIFYSVPEDRIPNEGVKKVDIKIENLSKSFKIFLVKKDNSLIAFSPACTHLGCFVNFDINSMEFVCPCHGGRYDIEGKAVAGPPKDPLNRLPIKIENKKVYVGIKI